MLDSAACPTLDPQDIQDLVNATVAKAETRPEHVDAQVSMNGSVLLSVSGTMLIKVCSLYSVGWQHFRNWVCSVVAGQVRSVCAQSIPALAALGGSRQCRYSSKDVFPLIQGP